MKNIPEVKLGIIAVSRDCFPIQLSERRRAAIVAACGQKKLEMYEAKTTVENENDMLKAVADKKITLRRAVDLIATNPAKAYGLYPQKGAIKIGADADFVLCDPYAEYVVDREKMFTKAKDTAKVFDGWKLNGVIDKVFLRGEIIYQDGTVVGKPGYGKSLLKGQA